MTQQICSYVGNLISKRNENICLHKNLYMNIHNSPKVETTQMLRWRTHTPWCSRTMECYVSIKGNEATDGCCGAEEL